MLSISTPDNEPADFYLNLVGPLLSRYEGPLDVVVDLGAHVGAFSMLAASEFGARLVIAIEPDPVNFSHLIINLEANKLQKKVLPIMACVAPKSFETAKLYFGGSSGQQSVTYDEPRHPYIEVMTLSLPDLFRLIPEHVDFMKVDIEGSEWEVFDKTKTIWYTMQHVGYIDFEFHPTNDPKYHATRSRGQIARFVKTLNTMGFKQAPGEVDGLEFYGYNYGARAK